MIRVLSPELKVTSGDAICLRHVHADSQNIDTANQKILSWCQKAFPECNGVYIIRPTSTNLKIKNCSILLIEAPNGSFLKINSRVRVSRLSILFSFTSVSACDLSEGEAFQIFGEKASNSLNDQHEVENLVKKSLMTRLMNFDRKFHIAWHFIVPLQHSGTISSDIYTDPMFLSHTPTSYTNGSIPENFYRGISKGLEIGAAKGRTKKEELMKDRSAGRINKVAELGFLSKLKNVVFGSQWNSYDGKIDDHFDFDHLTKIYFLPSSAVKTLRLLTEKNALIEEYVKKYNQTTNHMLANTQGSLTIVAGEAGTGKTIFALRAALNARSTTEGKIAYITWNRALRADVAMLAFTDNDEIKSITTYGLEEFVRKLSIWTNQLADEAQGLEVERIKRDLALREDKYNYLPFVERLHNSIISGLVQSNSILENDNLKYDVIVIDEAQDVLDQEISILRHFFPKTPFVIVHGATQVQRRCRAIYKSFIRKIFSGVPHLDITLKRQWRMREVQSEAYQHILHNVERSVELGDEQLSFLSEEESEAAPGGKIWILDCQAAEVALEFSLFRVLNIKDQYEPRDSLFIENSDENGNFRNTLDLLTPSQSSRPNVICKENMIDGLSVFHFEDRMPSHSIRVLGYLQARGCEGAVVSCLNLSSFLLNYHKKISHLTEAQKFNQLRQFLLVPFSRSFEELIVHIDSTAVGMSDTVKLLRSLSYQSRNCEWLSGDREILDRFQRLI